MSGTKGFYANEQPGVRAGDAAQALRADYFGEHCIVRAEKLQFGDARTYADATKLLE